MVVNNLDLFRSNISPNEADAVTIIDTDAMLPFSVTAQGFQPVTRGYAELSDRIKQVKLTTCGFP